MITQSVSLYMSHPLFIINWLCTMCLNIIHHENSAVRVLSRLEACVSDLLRI